MNMRRLLVLLLGVVAPLVAELPDFYKSVDRVFWVVDDLDRTVAGWQKLGLIDVRPNRNADRSVRWSVARLGDTTVDLIQPLGEKTTFGAYRKKHGQGVMALIHMVPTLAALEHESDRLTKAGVRVLERQNFGAASRLVLFDTAEEGKYVLGIACDPLGSRLPAAPSAKPNPKRLSQYAFVARDLKAVSRYWERLGFPAMDFTHPALWDLVYHGQPAKFDAILGWQRHGKIVFEWIQPTVGPTTYLDHLSTYGEGLHHIAFAVSDIEREKGEWTAAGYPTSQSGAWGERDKAGYGRFAYQDIHTIGGTEVELLWNYR
jgi:catechol 2,3-dioxygenase-like lactoylglutathione lyase family enzyme